MPFDVTETNPKCDWSYLTEGGASVVFAYVGQQHPVCSGKVLRVHKVSPHHLTCPDFPATPNAHETRREDDEDPVVAFQKNIISRLLPEQYLSHVQCVRVTSEWLSELAALAEPSRPTDRKQGAIDKGRKVAVLVTNLVVSGLVIEIKPKWGFLPAPAGLSPATLPFKTKYCRFCMHRRYKSKDAPQLEQTFCPLDLFSGDEGRIRRYLHGLWDSWFSTDGEMNNLRIFYDGVLIRPTMSLTKQVLSETLLGGETAGTSDIGSAFVDYLVPQVLQTDVLRILSCLQKTLDPLDIEGLCQLWSLSYPDLIFGQGEPEPSISEWKAFVDVYHGGGDLTLRQYLLAYLLSATFKDCSVITRKLGEKNSEIFVIDVGPKSIQRLKKWKELDENILSHFVRLSNSGPNTPCIQ